VWEVVRTIAAPPSIVVKGGGVVLPVVVRGVVLVVRLCVFLLCILTVCDLFLFSQDLEDDTAGGASTPARGRPGFSPAETARHPGILPPRPNGTVPHRTWTVAPPLSVVECLWEMLVWEFGGVFLPCVCVRILFARAPVLGI